MQQINKTSHLPRLMVVLMTATVLFFGCNSGSSSEEVSADSTVSSDSAASTMMAPSDTALLNKDSLPPLDTTIEKKPEPKKSPPSP